MQLVKSAAECKCHLKDFINPNNPTRPIPAADRGVKWKIGGCYASSKV